MLIQYLPIRVEYFVVSQVEPKILTACSPLFDQILNVLSQGATALVGKVGQLQQLPGQALGIAAHAHQTLRQHLQEST